MSKKKRINVVYSTNPDFNYEQDSEEQESIPFNEQKLYVLIDRKNRGGKSATLVEGFIGSEQDAIELSKNLKQQCGVGVGYKNQEIYIQGNHRDKVISILQQLGAKVKSKGG
jgi:translation initiation factor 1